MAGLSLILNDVGLDASYWLPHFENLKIGSDSLHKLDMDAYFDLEEYIRNDDEKKGIKQLMKTARRQHNLAKQNQAITYNINKPANMLQRLREAYSENKNCDDENVNQLLLELSSFFQISPEPILTAKESLGQHIQQFNVHLRIYESVKQNRVKITEVVRKKFSRDYDAQSVCFTNQLGESSGNQYYILNLPEVSVTDYSKLYIKHKTFTSKLDEEKFKRVATKFGHEIAECPESEIHHQILKMQENMDEPAYSDEMYLSTLHYTIIYLAKCSVKVNNLDLTAHAKQKLLEMSESVSMEDCEDFLKHGSHFYSGPFYYGGYFLLKCSSAGFRKDEKQSILCLHEEIITAVTDLTQSKLDVSNDELVENIKSKYTEKCSAGVLSSTKCEIEIVGGPVGATNPLQWNTGLLSDFSTCSWIDQGTDNLPIWEIIKNKTYSFGNVDDILCLLWKSKTVYKPEHIVSYANKWLPTEDVTTSEVQDKIEYLKSVKEDIMKVSDAKKWGYNYLSQISILKHIIKCIQHLQLQMPVERHHIIDLLQYVITRDDIVLLRDKKYKKTHSQAVKIISSWLYKTSEFFDINSVITKVVDMPHFIVLLESVKEAGDAYLSLEIPWSPKEISYTVSKGLNTLQSIRKDNHFMFVIIFLYSFLQTSLKDVTLELKPLSLADLKNILDKFHNERTKFEKNAKNKVSMEEYLIISAIKSSESESDDELINSILEIMKQGQPTIDNNILRYTKKFLEERSLPDLKKKFKSYKSVWEDAEKCKYLRSCPLNKNEIAHTVLHRLNLCRNYKGEKITLQYAMCIREESVSIPELKTKITSLKQVPNLLIHKMLSYDCRCRHDVNELMDPSSKFDETTGIHPVDNFIAIFLSSNDFLRQDLFCRLAKCQIAIPFVLPDPFTKSLIFPLWSMRSIAKEWKIMKDGKETTHQTHIVMQPMKIVSFLRIGEQKSISKSKSKIMNITISDEEHSYFFHYDCSGGHYNSILGDGLVDACWHLPSLKPTDLSADPVMFLNLHGDARNHSCQVGFLGRISTVCCIMITDKSLKLEEQISFIKHNLSNYPDGIIYLDCTNSKTTILRMHSNSCVINACQNDANLQNNVRKEIRTKLQDLQNDKKILSIENLSALAENMIIDEDNDYCTEAKTSADAIIKELCPEKGKKRDDILCMQGKYWKEWALADKDYHRGTKKVNQSINRHAEACKTKMKVLRQQQRDYAKVLTPVMKTFLKIIHEYAGDDNFMVRSYFFQFLKLELNYLSRKSISDKQHKFRSIREELSECENSKTTTNVQKCIALRSSLVDLQDEIIDASLGLEHLFRELGQLFEATQLPVVDAQFSNLPKLAAEILKDGYPLEIMDGDAAHVPLYWVTAVLQEAAKFLVEPKVFVFSVLGIQSTGKSTMLNTTFGLDFDVSAGRCTRGAFMQLIPLDKNVQYITRCSHILIIDTEGLRAPEKKSMSMHKRDNELATFVIGLANLTLINIYGEVTGDMSDILQTCVHAFLRMKNVDLDPSCKFIHQNAGASINCEVGRANLTKKLNTCASTAAKLEGKRNVEQFKDVIKFKDQDDIHYFPGLWKGDPPMAPINHGYSQASQSLQNKLVKVVCDRTSRGFLSRKKLPTPMKVTDFSVKVKDIWSSLLSENFVFSFRNTLEIIAYNSLELEYSKWEWKFQEAMLQWEIKAENEIKKKGHTDLSTMVKSKQQELRSHAAEIYEGLHDEMESYFEADEMIEQWKSNFEIKLKHLKNEFIAHAMEHCMRLSQNVALIMKFKKENEIYTKLITQEVQKYIENHKKAQDHLLQGLQEKNLDSEQLKYLQEREVFTLDKLEAYEKQNIISIDQLQQIRESWVVDLDEQKINFYSIVGCLRGDQIICILKNTHLKDDELEVEFEKIWKNFIENNNISPESSRDVNYIRDEVDQALENHVRGRDMKVLRKMLREKNQKVQPSISFIWSMWTTLRTFFHNLGYSNREESAQKVHELYQNVIAKVKAKLDEIMKDKTDFKKTYTKILLQIVDEVINESNPELAIEIKVTFYLDICEYAIPKFELMAKSFQEQNDPLIYLEKNVKGPLFTQFKNQCQQTKAEEGIASMLCAYLEEPIRTQVNNCLGIIIVNQMKDSDPCFSSKMSLKVKVLTDLYENDCFDEFVVYLTDFKKYLEKKIGTLTILFCDQAVSESNDKTRLQVAAQNETSRIVRVLLRVVPGINVTNINDWLSEFFSNCDIQQEIGEDIEAEKIVVGYDSLEELNLENFKTNIEEELKKLIEKLSKDFGKIVCAKAMKNWKTKPHEILEKIIGCTKQCPFCGEQCDLLDPNHEENCDHRIEIHRINCLAGWRYVSSSVMATDVCQAVICTDKRFKISHDTYHPYKDYKSIHKKWSISPDPSSESSLYWKWFMGKYSDRIAEHYKAKSPDIPEEWCDITWEEIDSNFSSLYNIKTKETIEES